MTNFTIYAEKKLNLDYYQESKTVVSAQNTKGKPKFIHGFYKLLSKFNQLRLDSEEYQEGLLFSLLNECVAKMSES